MTLPQHLPRVIPLGSVALADIQCDTHSAPFHSILSTSGRMCTAAPRPQARQRQAAAPAAPSSCPLRCGAALGSLHVQAPPGQRWAPVHKSRSPHGQLSQVLPRALLRHSRGGGVPVVHRTESPASIQPEMRGSALARRAPRGRQRWCRPPAPASPFPCSLP